MSDSIIERAYEEVNRHKQTVERDYHRLHYHLMPPVGLLNDPNGFIQWNGTYHLFYQWMPFKTGHGAKFWGHYSSTDLVYWSSEPIALAPTDWFDKNGCYSGSAVVDDGRMKLFYTGNVKDEQGNRETYQCMAESLDGVSFEKKGVVITLPEGYTAHFRDPKVWKHELDWYMVIGAQSKDLQGKAVLFKSEDLKAWTHLGVIAGSQENNVGNFGYMWECPDVFELDGKEILLVSPQGLAPIGMQFQNKYQTGYFVGSLDYESATFTHGAFQELDRGFEFYAPQTTLDEKGRRIMFGWMGVPEQGEEAHPTIKHKWIHSMTLPRELHLVDGKIIQQPVEELKMMRKNEVKYMSVVFDKREMELKDIHGESVELELTIKDNPFQTFAVSFRNNVTFKYDRHSQIATLERVSFVTGDIEKRQCSLITLEHISFFVDSSSIEIFINGGQEVFSARMFPEEADKSIVFHGNGDVIADITKWEIRP
ncbi:glycoside hydrolase family 32 protein [Bacillus alkalicellulosilyticus]|uniref:glycoside hydrolase family 32 protein n=1 Tax=Alkalihalobacterium alkalicellulosilyticum TaxID=1912214 RepID=UPI0009976976|nr:sucrose-6-phosphate hydrolase [Bacillus alkalicellulosilyticus]